jgi:NACHT domain
MHVALMPDTLPSTMSVEIRSYTVSVHSYMSEVVCSGSWFMSLFPIDGQDILDKLEPVRMNTSTRSGCLPNTRKEILKSVVDWVNDTTSEQNILWVRGLAGSGKSALSTTIATNYGGSGQLGAFLFFDRDVTERSNPTMVIRTLAHQLGSSYPRIGATIRAVVENNSNILASSLHLQFRKLLLEPLLSVDTFTGQIVIVLDALDECGTGDERETLLEILANNFTYLPVAIRTIITSRAELDICNAFEFQHHILAYELDITSTANSADIFAYFRYRMSLIHSQKRHLGLDNDWPGEEAFEKLIQRASGLFVWASTASKFINAHDPRRRLDIVLRGDVASGAEGALDALYKTALESIGLWEDEDFVSDFRAILGIILVARQPLSSSAIDMLLLLPEHRPSMHTISLLGCVLQQNPSVRVLHPSFADFLVAQERCGRDIWFFDRSTYHRHLAFRCLDRMDSVLQRNVCNMTLCVDRANEHLSEDVSYSCLFWIDHICAIENDFQPVVDRLRDFLYRHLLHWFEAMNILTRSKDTIPLVVHLLNWVLVSHFIISCSVAYREIEPCSPRSQVLCVHQ